MMNQKSSFVQIPKSDPRALTSDRLKALHHLDVPWLPSQIEQREGRIVRQGNQHEEVDIFANTTFVGYDQLMPSLYTAPSSICHLALMNLYPGHRPLSPGYRTGQVGSLTRWR